jgi:hypothetical protein
MALLDSKLEDVVDGLVEEIYGEANEEKGSDGML